MSEVVVSELNFYPIKSCAGTSAEELPVGPTGFEHDREWMVIDSISGNPITQRDEPRLALVQPVLTTHELEVSAPGMTDFAVTLQADNKAETIPVELFKKSGRGVDQGSVANDALSSFLDRPIRLLRHEASSRRLNSRYNQEGCGAYISFADGFPFLLLSEPDLVAINGQLTEPVPMNRFRPNIVIKDTAGELEAFAEDYWRRVQIGNLSALVARACARCEITDTNQITTERKASGGVRSGLRKLGRAGIDLTDPDRGAGLFFGQNLTFLYESGQSLRIGDRVEVVTQSRNRNIELKRQAA